MFLFNFYYFFQRYACTFCLNSVNARLEMVSHCPLAIGTVGREEEQHVKDLSFLCRIFPRYDIGTFYCWIDKKAAKYNSSFQRIFYNTFRSS